MSYKILEDLDPETTMIKVIGVGGCGGNAVEHMIANGSQGIEFIAANTDRQALQHSRAHMTIQLGSTGLGAGAKPEVGAEAALEKREQIQDAIRDADLLFITAGMGGGTGTGAAPVIAEIAREMGILTVAVVTRPFSFEGKRRQDVAQEGIEKLREHVDSMLVILNEKLECIDPEATMKQCYQMSNDVLYRACVGIADIIHCPGYVNLDFNDLKTVMMIKGSAIIGVASASGPDRATKAAEAAIACPLLEGRNLDGARGLLVYFIADESIRMDEVRKSMNIFNTFVSGDAQVIWGSAVNPEMGDELSITIVLTGMDEAPEPMKTPDINWGEVLNKKSSGTSNAGHVNTLMPSISAERDAKPSEAPVSEASSEEVKTNATDDEALVAIEPAASEPEEAAAPEVEVPNFAKDAQEASAVPQFKPAPEPKSVSKTEIKLPDFLKH